MGLVFQLRGIRRPPRFEDESEGSPLSLLMMERPNHSAVNDHSAASLTEYGESSQGCPRLAPRPASPARLTTSPAGGPWSCCGYRRSYSEGSACSAGNRSRSKAFFTQGRSSVLSGRTQVPGASQEMPSRAPLVPREREGMNLAIGRTRTSGWHGVSADVLGRHTGRGGGCDLGI